MNRIHIAPFPGTGLAAEHNRSRVAADFRGVSIFLSLTACAALALAGWAAFTQLAAIDAALACAAGV